MRKIIAGNKIPNILTSTQSAEIMEKNEADFIEGFSKKLIPANKFIIDKADSLFSCVNLHPHVWRDKNSKPYF